MDNRHTFSGEKINPPTIFPNMDCSELIDFFGRTGYNARRLAEAAATVREMIDSDSTICLTLAGA
ncbi:MAG: deoxyhypusine synthase, partial [Nitrososphaeraceae archaeon]